MMYLLDTHVVLWSLRRQTGKLGKETRKIIQSKQHKKLVSMASLWEVTIKSSLGKLDVQPTFFDEVLALDVEILDITIPHLEMLKILPHHHGDPFDRLLVAQAQAENITLITADKNIPRYAVNVLLARE